MLYSARSAAFYTEEGRKTANGRENYTGENSESLWQREF